MSNETNRPRRGQNKGMVNEKAVLKRKSIIRAIMVILILLIGFLIFRLGYKQIVVPTVDGKKPLSILLVGTDGAAMREEMWGDGKAELTDSLMVITFNPDTYRFEVTSIPRDTSVDYTTDVCIDAGAPEWQDQINELYYLSGNSMPCLESAVSNLLNVPIDYYVKVNMDEVVDIIDLLGGIEVTAHAADGAISEPSLDQTEYYTWYDGETYNLDGKEALSYVRARHDSEKDYGRGLRQQQVISATMVKVLNGSLTIELIDEMLDIVETDMAPVLIYQYYSHFKNIGDVLRAVSSDEDINIDSLNKDAWLNMFEYFEFDAKKVNVDTIIEFEEHIISEGITKNQIESYFFTSHQLFNEAYNGHYNVVEDQLQEISDALRINLGLETEAVSMPSAIYGDNEASGLTPLDWATGGSSSTGTSTGSTSTPTTTTPTTETPTTETPEVETPTEPVESVDPEPESPTEPEVVDPEPETDTDGDGVVDSSDVCPGGDDNVDSDGDTIPDACDDTPNGDIEETEADPAV